MVPGLATVRKGSPLTVLGDRPYMILTLLNTVILLYIPLLNMALPLWIALHTNAPLWIASVLYGLNTVSVMLMQVRLARRVTNACEARRSIFFATLLLSAACFLFAAMAVPSTVWLTVVFALLGGLAACVG